MNGYALWLRKGARLRIGVARLGRATLPPASRARGRTALYRHCPYQDVCALRLLGLAGVPLAFLLPVAACRPAAKIRKPRGAWTPDASADTLSLCSRSRRRVLGATARLLAEFMPLASAHRGRSAAVCWHFSRLVVIGPGAFKLPGNRSSGSPAGCCFACSLCVAVGFVPIRSGHSTGTSIVLVSPALLGPSGLCWAGSKVNVSHRPRWRSLSTWTDVAACPPGFLWIGRHCRDWLPTT